MLGLLFSRRWWWTTLLAIAAVGVMARLGIWQLDRLAQRRAFNARVTAQLAQPPLSLTGDSLNTQLTGMEYRSASARGEYDHARQVALRNQNYEGQPGLRLLTPLILAGGDVAVLVDRGWIPLADTPPEHWDKYAEPGPVEVEGMLRVGRGQPDFGGVPNPEGTLRTWNVVDMGRIAQQVPYPLLPVYLQQAPDPAWTALPRRSLPELDLSEGSHLGYAFQWFLFASVLAIGYPFYVIDSQRSRDPAEQAPTALY